MSGLHTSLLVQSVLDGLSYYMGWEPTILFHGADAATRDSLVGLLDTAAEHRRSAMAAALAWVGDDRVYELFSAWLVLPPPWVP